MTNNMQGHNHGGKNHLVGMAGIGVLVLLGLLIAGRSVGEALPLAALLACPLMMIGMMFMMMRGSGDSRQRDDAIPDQRNSLPAVEPTDPALYPASTSVKVSSRPLPLVRRK